MSFSDFTLIPPDDPQSSPTDDLDASVAGALALPDVTTPVTEDPPMPFGRTWRFDWENGQFVQSGQSPVDAIGLEAVAEWCEMAIHTARYSSPIFTDEFGMERPDEVIGEFAVGEVLADYQRNLIEALMVHERIASIENVELRWDPTVGVLYIDNLDVVTDEDETVTVSDVTLRAGGAT